MNKSPLFFIFFLIFAVHLLPAEKLPAPRLAPPSRESTLPMNPDKDGKPATVTVSGTVKRIYDGDTFDLYVTDKHVTIRVRIYGIDAPEHGQPYNKVARKLLESLISNQVITVKYSEMDRYGRMIGRVYQKDGTDVGLQLLNAGLAWHYTHFDSSANYAQAEASAKKQKKGLWQEPVRTAPWEYRKQKRQNNKKTSSHTDSKN